MYLEIPVPYSLKSAKQKIVTKSSTEAELVDLSDTASQANDLRNLIIAQGYDFGLAAWRLLSEKDWYRREHGKSKLVTSG